MTVKGCDYDSYARLGTLMMIISAVFRCLSLRRFHRLCVFARCGNILRRRLQACPQTQNTAQSKAFPFLTI